ncbi:SIR2 family NAD-dependent protein deacylase [Terrimonas alba]|uniref:SIR2 family NAD-dependent protein deacylase n=1 Tax=Terrimonas alba TaxID=3349636 RepID=UPI0035F471C2
MSKPHSPNQAVNQLGDQLSSEKRKLSFFFGAGTSMSVGLPGVFALTSKVIDDIDAKYKDKLIKLKNLCSSSNIEVILNKLRTIRELIDDSETESYHDITGKTFAQEFDLAICSTIATLVAKTAATSIDPHLNFANWLFKYQINRLSPVELFTTNYDLLLEEAFEERKIPYFDGFVGTINPFLVPECIDAENTKQYDHVYVPPSWLRHWKIHGSVNWFLYKDGGAKKRITRNTSRKIIPGDELMIFPSRQKYDESRRLPFLLFQDRLRKFLSQGEVLLIINGYSFNDEHINEIIFQALRANKRLAVTALMFGDFVDNSSGGPKIRKIDEKILKYGLEYPNLTILGPDKACVGGNISTWLFDGTPTSDDIFWIDTEKIFDLGDFVTFTNYLKVQFHHA